MVENTDADYYRKDSEDARMSIILAEKRQKKIKKVSDEEYEKDFLGLNDDDDEKDNCPFC